MGAFEQAPTSLNLFASDFTDCDTLGFEVPVLWFQSINSLFIIIFAPVFAAMWVGMSRRRMDLSDPAKFTVALILAGVGFALMVIPANAIVASGGALKFRAWWLTVSYLFQTLGELGAEPGRSCSTTKLFPAQRCGADDGHLVLGGSVGNLVAGLVGGHVDPEKLEQTPALFTWTAVAPLRIGTDPRAADRSDPKDDGQYHTSGAHTH